MCGLILARGDKRAAVGRALDRMAYRGLDGKRGVAVRSGWTLGHVRMAIQDLTDAGAQPTTFGKGKGVFAFVGEIFGHDLPSDLPLAVAAYEGEGAAGFHAFDGFWSCVAVHEDGYAEAFTDYLGQKPLYYWEEQGIVCSELDPMFELAPRPPLDQVYLSNCIKFGYDYSGRTPYVGITQLPAGKRLCFGDGPRPEILQYWDWGRIYLSERAPTRTGLQEALIRSISNRMKSDRPVGLLLSGGLDSMAIYGIAKHLGLPLQGFSIENGESEFLPSGVTFLSDQAQLWGRPMALQAMQAPLDLGSLVPQYQLAQALAEQGIHVCMTGDGADELFGGYSRAQAYDSQASDVWCELPYYHLPRLDRVMMRHTVEQRSPYLSPDVIKMALNVPRKDRTAKQFLKGAVGEFVPSAVLERPKHPLKSKEVREGGLEYRSALVAEFISGYARLKEEEQ